MSPLVTGAFRTELLLVWSVTVCSANFSPEFSFSIAISAAAISVMSLIAASLTKSTVEDGMPSGIYASVRGFIMLRELGGGLVIIGKAIQRGSFR
jgi:hypothetical protein